MKVAALETFLFGLTAYSAFKFLSSEQWQTSVTWWTATMICLLNFWVLGVPSLLRYGILVCLFENLFIFFFFVFLIH